MAEELLQFLFIAAVLQLIEERLELLFAHIGQRLRRQLGIRRSATGVRQRGGSVLATLDLRDNVACRRCLRLSCRNCRSCMAREKKNRIFLT
jgi:hypothetical protein